VAAAELDRAGCLNIEEDKSFSHPFCSSWGVISNPCADIVTLKNAEAPVGSLAKVIIINLEYGQHKSDRYKKHRA
jgi:hypothetical protein